MSGKKFILKFIKMYREFPCLWKLTHHDYHNKSKRNAALEELLELFQKVDPNANKYTVQKKIASLRGAFKKELNKVKTSVSSGAVADEVHVPKLWYFDHMLFLENTDNPTTSKTPRSACDMKVEVTEEIYNEDVLSPQSHASISPKRSYSTEETSFKRTKATKADLVLHKTSSELDTTDMAKHEKEKQDSSDAFGQYVAAEVRALPDNMKKICKKIINDTIFQAAIGQLNFTSRVVTDPS